MAEKCHHCGHDPRFSNMMTGGHIMLQCPECHAFRAAEDVW